LVNALAELVSDVPNLAIIFDVKESDLAYSGLVLIIFLRIKTSKKNKQNNIKNNTMFWGLPGSSHVQTSLENIVFLFLFLCGFNQFI
jgi:hypothetical protein